MQPSRIYSAAFSNQSLTAKNNGDETITLTVSGKLDNMFMTVANFPTMDLGVSSTAQYRLRKINAPCVLALHPSASDALVLDSNAKINAADCRVHSNSSSSRGIEAKSNSLVSADSICVVGSAAGGASHYSPAPEVGCPVLADPLATVPAPVVPNCDFSNKVYDNKTVTIDPGVYCGGISILNNSVVTFRPGIYFVKDGKFFVDSNAKVQGDGVGFYLTGNNATLHFTSNTRIDFTAPSTGALAGILFFEDRSAPVERLHYFDSNSITRETGSMYLSRGIFSTDSNSTIAANSAFTNVIARKVWIKSNASLTLNADYGATTVPNVAVYYEGVGSRMAGKVNLALPMRNRRMT
ncbi:hypothetical protein [Mesorhizobium sp.]|uniref:hypothetical protein n=1 Tax=Mesorhizobium sp. TaxID=1871066 RepID=UPI000FE2BEE3|nr:hypothetical protein [Mesorhizobium sp.]RWN99780.1 MAG: hypothetical protein EOS06_17920 [Mesorhizobium sp.]RWO37095.1 MAG: hypothetical protein EOS11_29670 [Mesorhizobium sp.]